MDTLQFDAIIFDMDGLLVDTERVWKIAESALLAARGKEYSPVKHEALIGRGMREFIDGIKSSYAVDDSAEVLTAELYERLYALLPGRIVVQPGAPELIAHIQTHNIPRAIASSSPLHMIDFVVSDRGWGEFFGVRASGDEVPRGKPAPDVYLLAAERLGIDPARCLALEDSPNGARAAVGAGMTCFAVPDTSHSQPAQFAGITPHVLGSLHAVLDVLQNA